MNAANKITLARILIPFLFIPVLMSNLPYGKTIALALFVIATISDWLDGYIARKLNITSDFGGLIDPLADKILVSAALICFIAVTPEIVKPWYVVVIISRDFLVTGLRLLAAKKNTVMTADTIGKHKTGWQMGVIITTLVFLAYQELSCTFPVIHLNFIFEYVPLALKFFYVAIVAFTMISGALYLWRYRSLYRQNV